MNPNVRSGNDIQNKNVDIKSILKDRKKLCIFIGAGASIMEPSSLPSFQMLNDEILQNLCLNDHVRNMAKKYVTDIHVKPEQLLQLVWDYMEGRVNPVECFQYVQPNINHHYITQLIAEGVHCIVTPNFDTCLEKAMASRNISFELYSRTPETEKETEKLLRMIQSNQTIIWKPHGDCRDQGSLCYTRTRVAQLSQSCYLQEVFSYIVKHFHILFLGYSGYDDDFYPILFQYIAESKNQIVWNAYSQPDELSPCKTLQERAADRFHIWVGDMVELLKYLTGDIKKLTDAKGSIDWKGYIKKQFDNIIPSRKIAVMAKYFNDYGLYDEAENLWKNGMELSKRELDKEDELRFQLNLGYITQEMAYKKAMQQSFFYIAEIALKNIIGSAIENKDRKTAKIYLMVYYTNWKDKRYHQYFKKGQYYNLLYSYKYMEVKYDDFFDLKDAFEVAYHALMEDGEITSALELLVYHYAGISTQNLGNKSLLQELIDKSKQLIPYGEKRMIAHIYFIIANVALTVGDWEIANSYSEKSMYYVEMCRAMGVFLDDQYYEIMSTLYHQKSMMDISDDESVQLRRKAIEYAKKIGNQEKTIFLLGFYYSGFCSMYMRTNFYLAKEYGKIALNYCKQVQNKRAEARVLTYLAVAYAVHGKRSKAITLFKKSYDLCGLVHEGYEAIYHYLEECGIAISEIK